MSADETEVPITFKKHFTQFERVDTVTFLIFIGTFVVWFLNYPLGSGWIGFFWNTGVPTALVAFAASRRWSALLAIGPAAPIDK